MSSFEQTKQETQEYLREHVKATVKTTIQEKVEESKAKLLGEASEENEGEENEGEGEDGKKDGEEEDEESETGTVEESLRLLKTLTVGGNTAKVYRDTTFAEYVVKFFDGSKYASKSDYFTDDQSDAISTAQTQLQNM